MAEDLGSIRYRVIADTNDLARAENEFDAMGNSAKKSGKDVDGVTKSMGGMSNAVRVATRAIAAMGVALGAREIIQYADAWQNATNQLKTVQKENENLVATQEKLMRVANESRSGFESTANLYTRLTRSTESLNLSQEETIALTDTINKSFAVSGATAQEASNAITQLSQGLAAGALRGEEFNSVSEQSPILMQAIADSLKMTRGELREFAADGGITAEIVVTALQQAADGIDESFAKMTATFGQSMEVAKNNMLEFVGSAEAVQDITGKAGAAVVILSENLDVVGEVAAVVGTVMAARLAGGLATAASSATLATGSIITLNGVLTALGGPVGIALITAAAIYKISDALIEARANSYRLAGDDFAKQALDAMGVSAEQASTNIDSAKNSILLLRSELASATEIYGENSDEVAELNRQLDLQQNWLNLNKLRQAELSAETKNTTGETVTFTEKTQDLIASLENQIAALHMTEREQAIFSARLKAIANGDGPEAIATIERLAGEYFDASKWQDQWNDSIAEYLKEQEAATKATEKQEQSVADLITKLENEQLALQMTTRAQAIFNATTEAYNNGAAPEQIAKIATLTAANYDLAESTTKAGKDAEAAAKRTEENWQRTHEYMTGAFVDLMDNGGNAFDNIAKSFESMVKRMVAEWAASGIMGMFSGQGLSGFTMDAFKLASGGGGGLSSASGLLSLFGGGGSSALPSGGAGDDAWSDFYSGGSTGSGGSGLSSTVKGVGASLVAGYLGSLAGNKIGESLFNKEANSNIGATIGGTAGGAIGGPLGAAIGSALGSMVDVATGGDGYKRSFAGMLTAPTAGAAGSTFAVDPFASGFRAQGIAHGASQQSAIESINVFRAVDAQMVELVTKLGGTLNLANATLSGTGIEGIAGTAGTFLGMGGKTTEKDIASMINQFVGDLSAHVTGIDDELLDSIRSAEKAEDVMRLLSEAVSELAVEQVSALESISNAQVSAVAQMAPMKNVFGADLWAETARQAWQPDAGFRAALNAAGVTNTQWYDGSHANGLNSVPFDGYRAELHKGERVLTASEANAMDMTGGGAMYELLKKVSLQLSIFQRWDFDGLPPERV